MTEIDFVLTSARLVMRPLAENDFSELHAILTEPGVRRYLCDDIIIPESQTRDIIARSRALFGDGRGGLWGIRRLSQPDLLGCVGYSYFHEPPRLELLYALSERVWGCGYATEAAHRMIEYGRTQLCMTTILASTDTANRASISVLDRRGCMRTEQRVVEGLDLVVFALQPES